MQDLLTELPNASFNFTCGQLVCGSDDKAKFEIRRLLSRGARVCRSSTAAVTALKTRPGRPRNVLVKIDGYKTEAILDFEIVPNPLSEKLCDKLSLKAGRHPVGLPMADGQRARSTGTVREVSVCSNHLQLTVDFHVV